jgi:transposase
MAQTEVTGLLRVGVSLILDSLDVEGRGWRVERVAFKPGSSVREVLLRLTPTGKQAVCGECGAICRKIYDRKRNTRVWRHTAAWGTPTWVTVPFLRRVQCRRCGIRLEALPWARKLARMTRALERCILAQAKSSSLLAVARNLALGWKAVFGTVRRAVMEGIKRKRRSWRHLGVDEFNYGRGQSKYLTIVWDHDRAEVAWAGEGKSGETLNKFFDWLGPRRARRIRCFTLDMADSYIEAIGKRAPWAKLVFDKFHIVRHLLDAVDELRKSEFWRKGGARRALVAGKRFLLLRRGALLTSDEQTRLREVLDANRDLLAAYVLKEDFESFWESKSRQAAGFFLWEWSNLVWNTGIGALQRFVTMLWVHLLGVLAYFDFKLTNGPVESQNSRTRLLSQRARGYRNPSNLIMMLYHCSGNLNYE